MSGIQTKSNAGLSAKEAFDQSVNIGWVCCQHRVIDIVIDLFRAALNNRSGQLQLQWSQMGSSIRMRSGLVC